MINKTDMMNFLDNEYYVKMIKKNGYHIGLTKNFLIFFVQIFAILYFMDTDDNIYRNHNAGPPLLLLTVFNLWALRRYILPQLRLKESKTWKKVCADIYKVNILETLVASKSGSFYIYIPYVSYIYEIEGKFYKNDKILLDDEYIWDYSLDNDTSSKFHKPNEEFEKWTKDKTIEIFYNPKNLFDSAVDLDFSTGRKMYFKVITIFSFIMLGFSIYDFIWWLN